MVFQGDYDEIELQKISCNVISVTSSLLRHQKRHQNNVTNFFQLAPPPPQLKFMATPVFNFVRET